MSAGIAMGLCFAQAPAPAKVPASVPVKRPAVAPLPANLGQLMKGILYPNANVIFAAQGEDPAKVPQDKDASTAVNPLASAYGGWQAVENSALAMAEASSLLMTPGRKCANGRAVPLQDPNWTKWAQAVRAVGLKAYKAAQDKNQDEILDVADAMTTACANCHDKYREVAKMEDRCK